MGFFKRARDESIEKLSNAMRKLYGEHEQLKEDFLRLKAAHESLRGYTYALKAKHVAGIRPEEEPTAPAQPAPLSKAELRKQLGIRPWEHKP